MATRGLAVALGPEDLRSDLPRLPVCSYPGPCPDLSECPAPPLSPGNPPSLSSAVVGVRMVSPAECRAAHRRF